MEKHEILLVFNVLATDMTDAKRQAAILAQDYHTVELIDIVCTTFSWEGVVDYPILYMFRVVYSIAKL